MKLDFSFRPGWRAAALVIPLIFLASAHGAVADEPATPDLRQSLRSHFIARPELRGGELHLRLFTELGGRDDVLCDAVLSEPPFETQVMLLVSCLANEKPEAYSMNILESPVLKRAADLALQRLRASGTPTPDKISDLVPKAQEEFRRALEETGVVDELVAGWKRIVEENSPCYRNYLDQLIPMWTAQQRKLQESGYCDSWARFLNVCSVEDKRLNSHIRYFRSPQLDPGRKRVLDELLSNGLGVCMAAVLEAKDAALAESISKFGNEGPSDPATRQTLGERAWAIWREHGIERWLDETLARGAMPEAVKAALDECAPGATLNVVRGKLPPPLGLRTEADAPFQLEQPPGRNVIVGFWASWCAPCKDEMRELSALVREWNAADRPPAQRVDYVAVNFDERPEAVRATLDNPDLAGARFAFASGTDVAGAWGVNGLPATVLLGADGRVIDSHIGYDPDLAARIRAHLESAAAGSAVSKGAPGAPE